MIACIAPAGEVLLVTCNGTCWIPTDLVKVVRKSVVKMLDVDDKP